MNADNACPSVRGYRETATGFGPGFFRLRIFKSQPVSFALLTQVILSIHTRRPFMASICRVRRISVSDSVPGIGLMNSIMVHGI